MTALIDCPGRIRPGEELDREKLRAYLSAKLGLHGDLHLEQFGCGYSNLTYLVSSGSSEWVLRRPPFGANVKGGHDMGREYRILSGLVRVFSLVPKPVLFCEDVEVLGAPFYLMERVPGLILRREPPDGIELSSDLMNRISSQFIETLHHIHQLDFQDAGLAELGKPAGYIKRQIEGWTGRYLASRTDDIRSMEKLGRWLLENKPDDEFSHALIHNDFKYDNLVLDPRDPGKIKACLDWEMATLGDPLMDLGSTLAYWVDPHDPAEWQAQSFCLTTLPGNLSREELLARYETLSGRSVPIPVFFYAYGLFKLAVIVQQIYARYKAGLTKDSRFASLLHLVQAASLMGTMAVEKKRVGDL